jgi:hypothetical protein
MLNIKQCKKVHHSKDSFWYNFIVTDFLKIEPFNELNVGRGGGLNFLDEGGGGLKIKDFRLGWL